MEKLYLVKLGNMYVTSASLTSIKLDETVEKAKVFKNVVEAESIANTYKMIFVFITFMIILWMIMMSG